MYYNAILGLVYFSLLGYPILVLIFKKWICALPLKYILGAILFFVVYDILVFKIGISLRGDFADFVLFSFHFLMVAVLALYPFQIHKVFIYSIRVLSGCIFAIYALVATLGFLVILIEASYSIPSIYYHFESSKAKFETRVYVLGGAWSSSNVYVFKSYRTFEYLPIEYKIDETELDEVGAPFRLGDTALSITLPDTHHIQFQDNDGRKYLKELK